MDVTDRWWATAGSGLVFVIIGVLAERPALLLAAAGLGAWILATAAVAGRTFTQAYDRTTVTYTLGADDTLVDTPIIATVSLSRPNTRTTLPVTVQATTPPGVTTEAGDQTLSLAPGDTEDTTEFTVTASISGRFEFPKPIITLHDPLGLYQTHVEWETTPTVTVRPPTPDLHVGRGGERVDSAYGQHQSDRPGPGVTIRELRQYVPGDDVQQIDWNATARLAETYIRETEGETDRRTTLIIDHRSQMGVGRDGETMLEYAREVGIGITRAAATRDDPLGLRTVGDDGLTNIVQSGTSDQTYAQIESRLYDLVPTTADSSSGGRTAREARERSDRLTDDETPFARILGAYLRDQDPYVTRIRDDPLVGTVRSVRNQVGADDVLVIVTSDTDPTTVTEAAKAAVRGGGRTILFLTPQCLFEPAGLTDLDVAYDQYRTFETLRQDLDTHPRMTALEIAPDSRVDAVLAHRRMSSTTR
ncbi:DUF58 domain-containing protein [Halorubrum sp. CGM4_25_10-8A]|uniref:DUF58 domain-containing protein n=1 Tax=Halorubrum sp. CGM4_25_10-8A TaxID=2518116 RepID=UPI0010F86ECD|nr:DUF58 domain-containing protein [Halorubrum sp. CGM4_25_10-8A]TKX40315.1 DUF58 domain-containing protein [Halorubrum sp. CGM4_25_10-8A]